MIKFGFTSKPERKNRVAYEKWNVKVKIDFQNIDCPSYVLGVI